MNRRRYQMFLITNKFVQYLKQIMYEIGGELQV